jgi:hypothetical protein
MRHVSAVRELVQSVMENGTAADDEYTGQTGSVPATSSSSSDFDESHVKWAAKHIKDHCPLMELTFTLLVMSPRK